MNPRSRDPTPMEKLTERVAIVRESTACLPPELVQRYRIGVLPIPFVFGTQTYLDGVDLTAEQFYEKRPGVARRGLSPASSVAYNDCRRRVSPSGSRESGRPIDIAGRGSRSGAHGGSNGRRGQTGDRRIDSRAEVIYAPGARMQA